MNDLATDQPLIRIHLSGDATAVQRTAELLRQTLEVIEESASLLLADWCPANEVRRRLRARLPCLAEVADSPLVHASVVYAGARVLAPGLVEALNAKIAAAWEDYERAGCPHGRNNGGFARWLNERDGGVAPP